MRSRDVTWSLVLHDRWPAWPSLQCDPAASERAILHSVSLPPGPTSHPAIQTLNWLFRPIDFMDTCRERYGDAFSVTFLGFETPMVMV